MDQCVFTDTFVDSLAYNQGIRRFQGIYHQVGGVQSVLFLTILQEYYTRSTNSPLLSDFLVRLGI